MQSIINLNNPDNVFTLFVLFILGLVFGFRIVGGIVFGIVVSSLIFRSWDAVDKWLKHVKHGPENIMLAAAFAATIALIGVMLYQKYIGEKGKAALPPVPANTSPHAVKEEAIRRLETRQLELQQEIDRLKQAS